MIIENKKGDQLLQIIYIEENDEMTAMCLYERGMDIGYINEIDNKLLEYYQYDYECNIKLS